MGADDVVQVEQLRNAIAQLEKQKTLLRQKDDELETAMSEVDQLQQRALRLKQVYSQNLTGLQKEHGQKLADLKKVHSDDVDLLKQVHLQNLAGLQQEHIQKLVDLKKVHSDELQKKQREIQDALDETLWKHSKYLKLFEDMSCKTAVLPDDWSSWFPCFCCVGVFLVCRVCMVIHTFLAKPEQKPKDLPRQKSDSILKEVLECASDRRDQQETARMVSCLKNIESADPSVTANAVSWLQEMTTRMLQVPRITSPQAGVSKLSAAIYCAQTIQGGFLSPSSQTALLNRIVLLCQQESVEMAQHRLNTSFKWMRKAICSEKTELLHGAFRILTALSQSKRYVDSLMMDHGEEIQTDVAPDTPDNRLSAEGASGEEIQTDVAPDIPRKKNGTPDMRRKINRIDLEGNTIHGKRDKRLKQHE